ncbi:MAG: hypothetical protein EBZ48_01735 [Proteobacteria bacterium]|nr:hypothetical protein [Pseudomonadota bacterium]
MHIYRYFQPHHNPRLVSTPIRQLELSELEQAASELRKALERAQQRTAKKAVAPLMSEHFTDLLKAMRFVESSLQTLCDAHPGDQPAIMLEMIHERNELVGWETWTSLLEEQLISSDPALHNPRHNSHHNSHKRSYGASQVGLKSK